MAGRLQGKVAVVTGGCSGIGLAAVRRFAEEGAQIALLDRDPAGEEVAALLRDRGHDAWVVPDDAAVMDLGDLVDERPLTSADLLVCLGGDGTMLRAVRLLDGAPVPLLGVNVGVLGYLTEIEPPELTDALERLLAGLPPFARATAAATRSPDAAPSETAA